MLTQGSLSIACKKNNHGERTWSPQTPRVTETLMTDIQEPQGPLVLMKDKCASGYASKPPDLHVLLLEDLLVLLQRQDERLLLKCHSKTAVGSADSKQTFSPVLKLNAVLIRSVATGTYKCPTAWALGHDHCDLCPVSTG